MADPTPPSLQIPPEVQAQFGELIELIKGSESMNDEERQYWVNILPIMTPEQIQNLRDILDNERSQLAAIDNKYQSELSSGPTAAPISEDDRRKKREERQSKELAHKEQEEKATEDILKAIEEH
jgi:Spy/CpxP family protein refolding chaperone